MKNIIDNLSKTQSGEIKKVFEAFKDHVADIRNSTGLDEQSRKKFIEMIDEEVIFRINKKFEEKKPEAKDEFI